MHSKTILFLGHSLIEFFDWQQRFPEHRVYNLGRAGETVEGLLSRTGGIIEKHPPPDLIFIMTGLNNVAMEDFDFLDSFREIIGKLSVAYPESRIFINSLLPTMLEEIPDESIRRVNRSLKVIAGETGAEFLDIYSTFTAKGVEDCLLPDGVHLNNKGYALWAEAVERLIRK